MATTDIICDTHGKNMVYSEDLDRWECPEPGCLNSLPGFESERLSGTVRVSAV